MELWNIGLHNLSIADGLSSDLRGTSKKDFTLVNPLFQPSNIPSFHGICLRPNQLTRPGREIRFYKLKRK